jgi:predicted transcriptional regulator
MSKRMMTLNLTDAEMRVLEEMAERKELTKVAVLRQALRLYQLIDVRLSRGETLYFENDLTKAKAEFVVL